MLSRGQSGEEVSIAEPGQAGPASLQLDDLTAEKKMERLSSALRIVGGGSGLEFPWRFPEISDWRFASTDEGLDVLATIGEANYRYYAWLIGDICAAFLAQFTVDWGDRQTWKSRIGGVLGCGIRTVEKMIRRSLAFPATLRYPDVSLRLYDEALIWTAEPDEPLKRVELAQQILDRALEQGLASTDLRRERERSSGFRVGRKIIDRQRVILSVEFDGQETHYKAEWGEKSDPRIDEGKHDALITVKELLMP